MTGIFLCKDVATEWKISGLNLEIQRRKVVPVISKASSLEQTLFENYESVRLKNIEQRQDVREMTSS